MVNDEKTPIVPPMDDVVIDENDALNVRKDVAYDCVVLRSWELEM